MHRLFEKHAAVPAVQHAAAGRAAAVFAASLKLENIGRRYGDAQALEAVSLDVDPGEIVCLLGPSGCGKTTLLRIVAGIETPTSGRVLINAREVAGPQNFDPPERRGVGLMFQDFALFPHLSVLDNVAFGLRSLPRAARVQAALAILSRVGMGAFAAAFPSTLSGGQQQRVALARAIVPRPSVMLMDEPFSGLDVQMREAMQGQTLELLRETRATSLIVTHNPDEAMRLADRIAVMRAGRLVQIGKAETLYREPATLFVARLFSEINEIAVRVQGGYVSTAAGRVSAPGMADGTNCVLCVRERAVSVVPQTSTPGEGLAGRVIDSKFLGDAVRLEVAVQGFDQPFKVRFDQRDAIAPGREVTVTIDAAGIAVFPAEELSAQA